MRTSLSIETIERPPDFRARAVAAGKRVVGLEAAALSALAEHIGESFADAVETILAARGRVVVCGMGKSGHVARKIAATLASTGTPAQFLHPAEASHGDLGMLTDDDAALLLSYSGETTELADVIGWTRRRRIPLIGVASRPDSALMRAADVALHLPRAEEACHIGLAPTTSTTMTMALGDALAVALMERRGFTPDHFRDFHPGGALGRQLVKVSDLMHRGAEMPLVGEATPMRETLLVMTAKGFGIAGVLGAQGRLVGVVTDGDLRRNMDTLLTRDAGEVATRDPLTIDGEQLAMEALAIMNDERRQATCLFVTAADDPRPVGVIHVHDLLRAGVT